MPIKLIILDVDGTLTDGGIYYGSDGTEYKKFCVQDGTGVIAAEKAGIDFAIMTARDSAIVVRRAEDLKIKYVFQNVHDKKSKLAELINELDLSRENVAYIGDDLIDIEAMSLCDFVACPANAVNEVKAIADYIAKTEGGHGAVREIIDRLLAKIL